MKAFPHDTAVLNESERGMDLRDYFAVKALQGMLACPDSYGNAYEASRVAYLYADAMMEIREND